MTGQPVHVLIVGAGLAGVRTVEQLRLCGYQGRISLIGAEPHQPYDRPPLSKQILTGQWPPERAVLSTPEQLDELGVRAHLGLAAVALRPGEIDLADGSTLYGDAIVIATGLVARTLPAQPPQMATLRTLDDALALREKLAVADSLVVVGAGFIGAEVASAARAAGLSVTVLEAAPTPAATALGGQVSELAGRLFGEAGVDLRTGVQVVGLDAANDGVRVRLGTGDSVEAAAGLVGIGGVPRLGWLGDYPAPGGNPEAGLHCDASGRVHGWDEVWAVGDVAAWDTPDGVARRHEHWTSAVDQAAVVARDILRAPPPRQTVPYFWSDQFGLKIQLIGRPELADQVMPLHGNGFDGGAVRGTVAAYLHGDRLVGVVGFGAARQVVRYRALVAAGAPRAEAQALAATL